MSMNQLEEIVREYYEYIGYFVKTNIKFGKRVTGGYSGEVDVIAYKPNEEKLVYIECSQAALSDKALGNEAQKKFPNYINYKNEFKLEIKESYKIFIVGQSAISKQALMPEGVEHKPIKQFMKEVYDSITEDFMHQAVPEVYPLLRTIQLVKWGNK